MTFERIRDVIAFTLSRDKEIVRREARLKEDLEMDSFDYAELASTLEQEFGIDISDEEMAGWKTVSDVAACLQKEAREPSLPHAADGKSENGKTACFGHPKGSREQKNSGPRMLRPGNRKGSDL